MHFGATFWPKKLTKEEYVYQNCTIGRITKNDQYLIVINTDTKITALYCTNVQVLITALSCSSGLYCDSTWWGEACEVQGVDCQPHHGGHSDWPLHQVSTQQGGRWSMWVARLTIWNRHHPGPQTSYSIRLEVTLFYRIFRGAWTIEYTGNNTEHRGQRLEYRP